MSELVKTSTELQVFDLASKTPDLYSDFEAGAINMIPEYWKPEEAGESKRVFFYGIGEAQVSDSYNSEDPDATTMLRCAVFLESKEGVLSMLQNGSKRLVGAIESLGVTSGAAIQITYLGKRKNASNNFSSDVWSIVPLIPKVAAPVDENLSPEMQEFLGTSEHKK